MPARRTERWIAGARGPADRRLEARGNVKRPILIHAILETALGVENAFAVATAGRRVVALTIGLEDYAADLGVPRIGAAAGLLVIRVTKK